jgi:hypothetical protein
MKTPKTQAPEDVNTQPIITPPPSKEKEYYRLVKDAHNLFSVETVTMVGNIVFRYDKTTPTLMPIAFDQLRRKTSESFFNAVKENSKD